MSWYAAGWTLWRDLIFISAPKSRNVVSHISAFLDHMHSTFCCIGIFLKWLADDQSSSITKGSFCYIKHMYIHVQPFSMEVDWWEYKTWNGWIYYYFKLVDIAFLLRGADLEGKTVSFENYNMFNRHTKVQDVDF